MKKYIETLKINDKSYQFFDIKQFALENEINFSQIPFSIKIILENLLRNSEKNNLKESDIVDFCKLNKDIELPFSPTRVLMQDFTGVPAIVDLAMLRDKLLKLEIDPKKINPLVRTDLIIDHSVQVDSYGSNSSLKENSDLEFKRNIERYEFLKWGQSSFENLNIVPPGMGICHQINLECLSDIINIQRLENKEIIGLDTIIGTDSHTTMINGLGVLGWGVGGIEAEAVMLGESISMTKPQVIGVKMKGCLSEIATATDLVLTITEMLRKKNVVGKFVEFFGEGIKNLSLPDRATIANMAPEYGATCGIFPVDEITIEYLKLTRNNSELEKIVEIYFKSQGLWSDNNERAKYDDLLTLDLSKIETVLAGPKRPQDMVKLSNVKNSFSENYPLNKYNSEDKLQDGSVVIAAITSCTNTSNPDVLIAAGLLAKRACELGLKSKDFVKTSLTPGSRVVGKYLSESGLQKYLDQLGFNISGYGCTTCIGNSGALKKEIEQKISTENLTVSAVISGNRNFEGRVHPSVKSNYLASPPLVVAYSIAGNVNINLDSEAIGISRLGKNVFLKDIWPSKQEIQNIKEFVFKKDTFVNEYKKLFDGCENWKKIEIEKSLTYNWRENSTYIKNPPYLDEKFIPEDIKNAKILAVFGNSITTDHISPAGNITEKSPAGEYLLKNGIAKEDFNSYGSRRGNHEIMIRGTFANKRIKNELLDNIEGGFTLNEDREIKSIYEIAMQRKSNGIKSVIFAGKEYGTGSSRDWAAKGTKLLGIFAIIAESFERIHRSNLIGMSVLPLEFINGKTRNDFDLQNCIGVDIIGIENDFKPKKILKCKLNYKNGGTEEIELLSRLDTERDVEYYISGGIFNYVFNKFI